MSHWYFERGGVAQRYIQRRIDGTATERINEGRARRDGAVPSTTTILSRIGGSEGLVEWAAREGVMAGIDAWHLGLDLQEGVAMCRERRGAAAERGTLIHAAIEAAFRGEWPDDPILARACKVALEAVRDLGGRDVKTETVFVHNHQYGGTVDCHWPGAVLDFKTVGGKKLRDPKPTEGAQLVSYRDGLGLDPASTKLFNIYIVRETGELARPPWEWTGAGLDSAENIWEVAQNLQLEWERCERFVNRKMKGEA